MTTNRDASSAQRRRAVVSGRVQGVSFRVYCQQRARELGLVGRVQNRADGAVQVEAEGDPGALDALVEWLGQGPRMARVTRVDVSEIPAEGSEVDFAIT